MMNFWKMMKTSSVGRVATVAPVMISSQSVMNSPENAAKPTGIVNKSAEFVTISGHRYWFQAARNENTASAAIAVVASTGGGAGLELLEGRTLPAVAALERWTE